MSLQSIKLMKWIFNEQFPILQFNSLKSNSVLLRTSDNISIKLELFNVFQLTLSFLSTTFLREKLTVSP